MTRIRNTSVRSVSKMSFGFIMLTITSINAFGVVPSHRYVSTNSLLMHNAGAEQYKKNHRTPASTALFAEKRKHDDDKYTELKMSFETSSKIETEIKNTDHQQAIAGLVLALTIAFTTIGGFPLPANAGFGPTGGATTTPPPNLKSITTTAAKINPGNAPTNDLNINLDGKKLKYLIDSSLNSLRLDEFSGQLDVLIDNLRDSISVITTGDETESETPKYDANNNYIESKREAARRRTAEREAELIKAQNLRLQIERQQKNLVKLRNQPYWFNYFAAFVGSTVSTLIMHPLDTIKTRLQVGIGDEDGGEDGDGDSEKDVPWQNQGGAAVLGMSSTAAPASASAKVTVAAGEASAITSTSTSVGTFDNLYQGLTGNLFKEVPPSAVYLGVYETVKYALSPKVAPAYLLLVYLVAGAAGETVGSIIRAPAEAVKSLVQSNAKDNALEAAKSVLGTAEGRANVFRAWSASIGRDVPFGAIQLAAFETIKAYILNNPNIEIDSSTLLSEAVIGAFAGGLGALVTNPTDVITTRIITQDTTEDPLGVVEMGKKIYDENGAGAFFVGWGARVGYWAPAISIFLTCYCSVRQAGIRFDLFP